MGKGQCDGVIFDLLYPHPDKDEYNIVKENSWNLRGTHLHHHMFNNVDSKIVEKGSNAVADKIGLTAFPGILGQGLQVIREIIGGNFRTGEHLLDQDGNFWIWVSLRWLDWWRAYASTINLWEWIFPSLARYHWQLSFLNEGFIQLGGEIPVDNIGKGSICQ